MSNTTISYGTFTDSGNVQIGGADPDDFRSNMIGLLGVAAFQRVIDTVVAEIGISPEAETQAAVATLANAGMVPQAPNAAGYQPPPPAQEQQAPPGWAPPQAQAQAPSCQHGQKVYREDKQHTPPEWRAWGCPAKREDPTRCPLQYI